jgi:hypothetical protein
MLLKLGNRVTNPNLSPIWVNAVGSNPMNNEILAVIGFGASGIISWKSQSPDFGVLR